MTTRTFSGLQHRSLRRDEQEEGGSCQCGVLQVHRPVDRRASRNASKGSGIEARNEELLTVREPRAVQVAVSKGLPSRTVFQDF